MRQCVGEEEKTNEDCVEAVWEKRRMREKRWCARSKIPDGVRGIRFLLFIGVCFGGAEHQGRFDWGAGDFTVFSLSSLPFYYGQS